MKGKPSGRFDFNAVDCFNFLMVDQGVLVELLLSVPTSDFYQWGLKVCPSISQSNGQISFLHFFAMHADVQLIFGTLLYHDNLQIKIKFCFGVFILLFIYFFLQRCGRPLDLEI